MTAVQTKKTVALAYFLRFRQDGATVTHCTHSLPNPSSIPYAEGPEQGGMEDSARVRLAMPTDTPRTHYTSVQA